MNTPVGTLPLTLLHMMAGCWISQALYVVAKLGIADLLQAGPKSCAMLAEDTETHARSLYRVLRALASIGVFAEDGQRCFRLTPLAEPLQANVQGSLRAFAIMLGEKEHWRAWEGALHSVRTGRGAFEHIFGTPHFQYFEEHEGAARIFDAAMTSRSGRENDAIVAAYDFTEARMVVEIGGGQGSLMTSILESYPNVRGVLFDLPHVIATSRKRMENAGKSRCAFVAGDFFAAVPTGGDTYVAKKVIHDWDDERARLILSNCRDAMSSRGRLLLIEPVISLGNDSSFNKLLDLLMLVWTSGGLERTEDEHRTLLMSVGFRLNRVIPTKSGVDLIEAVPV